MDWNMDRGPTFGWAVELESGASVSVGVSEALDGVCIELMRPCPQDLEIGQAINTCVAKVIEEGGKKVSLTAISLTVDAARCLAGLLVYAIDQKEPHATDPR